MRRPVSNFYPRSPRGERRGERQALRLQCLISIHAPREGSDGKEFTANKYAKTFLSTLPARGATAGKRRCSPPSDDFYPRSPRGERRIANRPNTLWQQISIHAPREGSDLSGDVTPNSFFNFYPRSPRGERPGWFCCRTPRNNFYPRSPRGERPVCRCCLVHVPEISIHAPREGSDSKCAEK